MALYDSILETVGRTPHVRLARLAPPHVNLYGKVEAFNPGGSVKDRLALAVIEDAERRGVLKPGQTVIEATSGNTGIALAMVCARKGYPLVIVMAENFSVERRKLMRFLGARVVLTPAALRGSGMLAKAKELARHHGWFFCDQFANEANADVHSQTTAEEILADFPGGSLDCFITGAGSGGTLKGVARVLRARSPGTRIVVVEPDNAPMLAGPMAVPDGESHPAFRPHLLQGISPDFIPPLAGAARREGWIDRVHPVNSGRALEVARQLAAQEGILAGISSGATLAAALEIARTARAGANILCMLPDTGERYQSTPLFDGIAADMEAREEAISRSTPSARFDVAAPAVPAMPLREQDVTAAVGREFVAAALEDRSQPVLLFGLEWCEFSGSVRRMLYHFGVSFRAIDLDSADLRREDLGGQIRSALKARTGMWTLPQIFIGGEFIGGCTELVSRWRTGEVPALLARLGVSCDRLSGVDPSSFLPAWLQPRGHDASSPAQSLTQGDSHAHLRH